MLQEIRKKMVILKNHMPFTPDIKSYFRHIEEREWLHANLELEGSSLTPQQADSMADGEICSDASVGEHVAVQKIAGLPDKMWSMAEMKRELELNLLKEIYVFVSAMDGAADDRQGSCYRKRNTIIQELSYTPPLPSEIPGMMEHLAGMLIEADGIDPQSEKFFLMAASIHDMIAAIVPYGQQDRLVARSAAAYYMISKGYPLIIFDLKEQEYNLMIERYIKTGKNDECAEALKKALLERLRLMTQLTRY